MGSTVTRVFTCGEDTLALRLASQLADLRAEYVNRIPLRVARGARLKARATPPKVKKTTSRMGSRFLWRRHPDLNRGIEVLQTFALPLGYDALLSYALTL